MRAEATIGANGGETAAGEGLFAFPLTAEQASMWPRGRLAGGRDAGPDAHLDERGDVHRDAPLDARFNGSFRMRLAGKVDQGLLQRSLREIVQRHETLRTVFRALGGADSDVGGGLQQVILPLSALSINAVDLRALSEADRNSDVDRICTVEAQTPFDLAAGTPLRVKLLRVGEEDYILTLTIHQIVCDGWSIGLLMEELSEIYAALAASRPPRLAPLDFQYGDYVLWQREALQGPAVQAQFVYWREKLAGSRPLRVRPDFDVVPATNAAGIVSHMLSRELALGLRSLGQAQSATFFVVTLAACMALLHRYTGETDLAIQTPLAGRSRVEFERIIGQFVNHAVIRAGISEGIPVAEFIESVRESVWEALANQDAPFEEATGPAASARGLYRINFVCQREYGRSGPFQFVFDGIRMTTLPSKSQGALYDLNFFLVEREAGWRLSLEYKTELYSHDTAASLLGHFQEILQGFVADPQQPLSGLPLSKTEALDRRMTPNSPSSEPAYKMEEEDLAPAELQAIPSSLAQERFWTLSQIDSSNPMFHIPVTMKLTGRLSVSDLERSLELLVDRHETLRTTFAEIDGELMQLIHDSGPVSINQVDLEHFGPEEKASLLEALVRSELEKPFDLSVLPLFHVTLCRLAEEDHVLVLSVHHTIADAWSMQVFDRELWTVYEGLLTGSDTTLAPLALQYADYSVWQREALTEDGMKAHLDYWLNKLPGDVDVINFPTDHVPAYRPASHGAIETLLLPEDLARSLKRFAQSSDVTLFVVALACFGLVLARGSDAEDLIVGSPVVNRRLETEPLIGPFAGPIPLRLDFSDNPTLREVVLMARDTTLEALGHAELPFEALLRRLRVRPSAGRSPLFQFYFFCQAAFLQSRQLPGISVAPQPTRSMGIPFELQLGVIERTEGIRAELEYNSNLFERSTIQEWLGYYETVIASLVENPGLRVKDLPPPPRHAVPVQDLPPRQRAAHGPASRPGATSSGPASAGLASAGSGDTGQEDTGFVGPRDATEVALVNLWEKMLEFRPIGVTDTFFSLGGRSLMLPRLLKLINKEFGTALDIPALFLAPTVEQLAGVIGEVSQFKERSSLVPMNVLGDRKPFFMVHSYMLYGRLPAALGEAQPFYGLKQPPLDKHLTPAWVDDMLDDHVRQIRLVQPEGPYQITGWCFAGFMAYEIARRLEASGSEVSLLALLDSWCPYNPFEGEAASQSGANGHSQARGQIHSQAHAAAHGENHAQPRGDFRPGGVKSRLRTLQYVIGFQIRRFWKAPWKQKAYSAYRISRETFLPVMIRTTRQAEGIAFRFFSRHRIPLPKRLQGVTVVTYEWIRHYQIKPYSGKIVLFRPAGVPVPPDSDPTCGWGFMTTGEVESVFVPGDRRSMFLEPNVAVLAEELRSRLSDR